MSLLTVAHSFIRLAHTHYSHELARCTMQVLVPQCRMTQRADHGHHDLLVSQAKARYFGSCRCKLTNFQRKQIFTKRRSDATKVAFCGTRGFWPVCLMILPLCAFVARGADARTRGSTKAWKHGSMEARGERRRGRRDRVLIVISVAVPSLAR
jgi:hypothetical protein